MKSFFFKQNYIILSLVILSVVFVTNHLQDANASSGFCLQDTQLLSGAGWGNGFLFAENINCALPGKTVNIVSLNVVANADTYRLNIIVVPVIVALAVGNVTVRATVCVNKYN